MLLRCHIYGNASVTATQLSGSHIIKQNALSIYLIIFPSLVRLQSKYRIPSEATEPKKKQKPFNNKGTMRTAFVFSLCLPLCLSVRVHWCEGTTFFSYLRMWRLTRFVNRKRSAILITAMRFIYIHYIKILSSCCNYIRD